MAAESKGRVLITAAIVCLVCSVLVSVTAVALKPVQDEARTQDRKRNIVEVLGLYEPGMDVDAAFAQLTPRVITLDNGTVNDTIDPLEFDMFAAAKKRDMGDPIPQANDIASIKYRPKYATVYFNYADDGSVDSVVIPVQGYGLWSTMYAFVAMDGDGNTIDGINFYEQAETPGLGGEVTNPSWRAKWEGKKIYDESGDVALTLVKGGVDPDSPGAEHKIDALSGATLTSNGVAAAIQYWLSDAGYKPFLQRVADGEYVEGNAVAQADR